MTHYFLGGILYKILEELNRPFWADWSFWSAAASIASVIAFVILTGKILRESVSMRKAAFMPFLCFAGGRHDLRLALQRSNISLKGQLHLVNLGKGVAVDVMVDDLEVGYYRFSFVKTPLILIEEKDLVNCHPTIISSNRTELSSQASAGKKMLLLIRCKDQLGNKYTFQYDITDLERNPIYISGREE